MPCMRESTTSTKVGRNSYIPNVSYTPEVQEHTQKMDDIFWHSRTKEKAARDMWAPRQHAKLGKQVHPLYCVINLIWYNQLYQKSHHHLGLQRWVGAFWFAAITPGPKYTLCGVEEATTEEMKRILQRFHSLSKVNKQCWRLVSDMDFVKSILGRIYVALSAQE